MAKTRSQVLGLAVKKEEHENKPKVEQLLHGTDNASKSKSKITKSRKLAQAQNVEVKSENANDNKAPLTLPKKTFARSKITVEQIAKLIGYVVNNKMSVRPAARKVGINESTALRYYREYRDDPEHKIPLPKTRLNKPLSTITQEKIDNLIRYLVNYKMNLSQASKTADMARNTAARYYAKYLEDPERKIPLLNVRTSNPFKRCTQEDIADLIGYVVRDEMTLAEASKKVNISLPTAKRYYLEYLQNPNYEIPDACESNQRCGKYCTNNQVSSLIGYIVNDRVTLLEASVKANMSINSARRYYRQYLGDPENNIPKPESYNGRASSNRYTLNQVKSFFYSVIVDKLNVTQASRKANLSEPSGRKYYKQYLKNPNNQTKIKDMTYSVEKMKRLVELVQNEKMSLSKAAEEVNLNNTTARECYQQYLKSPRHEFPVIKTKQFTQEDIKKLIDYIEGAKINVLSAARKIKMNSKTAKKYYKIYQNDPEHKIPVPMIRGHAVKNRTIDKYTRIIADIYKNNPSIKPSNGSHYLESDVLDIKPKEESIEDEAKMLLKARNS